MPKLYIPTKKLKKVTLKVEVTQETLDKFIQYQEYLIERLGNDAEARASVDPGDLVTRGLKPWLESAEFEQWIDSRKPKSEPTRMLRTG